MLFRLLVIWFVIKKNWEWKQKVRIKNKLEIKKCLKQKYKLELTRKYEVNKQVGSKKKLVVK